MRYLSRFDQGADEPLTPVGRLFSQPSLYQIMHTAVFTAGPVDVAALKAELANSAFTRFPPFTLIFYRDKTGREYWKKTSVVFDDHVKVIDDENIATVNDYIADLTVSSPLPTDKPLWEVHVLPSHNCILFRIHHALADGTSTMSLLQSICRSSTNSELTGKKPVALEYNTNKQSIWEMVKMVWFTFIYVLEFVMRCLWLKDPETVVAAQAGLELWPRKLATASFKIADMKLVKNSVFPNATVNDVILTVLSAGLSAYINLRSPDFVQKGRTLTAVTMSSLRPLTASGIPDISDLMEGDSKTGWGNKISFVLHPLPICKLDESDPFKQLEAAKASMDRKKLSKVACMTYFIGNLAGKIFGPEFQTWMLYNLGCQTAFLFSNVIGPLQEIYIAGNRVTSISGTPTSSPQAMTLIMVSYAGKAELQILVAKDIIPDPEVLAKCFEEALQLMKAEAIKLQACKTETSL